MRSEPHCERARCTTSLAFFAGARRAPECERRVLNHLGVMRWETSCDPSGALHACGRFRSYRIDAPEWSSGDIVSTLAAAGVAATGGAAPLTSLEDLPPLSENVHALDVEVDPAARLTFEHAYWVTSLVSAGALCASVQYVHECRAADGFRELLLAKVH